MRQKQKWVLAGLGAAVGLGLTAVLGLLAAAEAGGNDLGVDWEVFATGLAQPVDIAFTGIPTDTRMFVVERDGVIKIVENNGNVLGTPFLDIDDIVNAEKYQEMGLLGLAFDPDYANNGFFYVYYTDYGGFDENGNLQLSRFQVSADPNIALTTEVKLLNIPHPFNDNHNGGDLNFGPDGYLYLAPGDGGGGNDDMGGLSQLDNDAQRLNSLLGKVLRLDVTDVATYTVPASNPFTQTVGAKPEIWAWGLRNPWRFSFDAGTGDLYIGDVGQDGYEEIDRQAAGSAGGQNYGWRCFEGTHSYLMAGCTNTGAMIPPIFDYDHDLGEAVTGGYVYRGDAYPSLNGYYFFADYVSRHFWAIATGNHAVTDLGQMLAPGANPSTFGQDLTGEIYVADLSSGDIYRLTGPAPIPLQTPYFLPQLTR